MESTVSPFFWEGGYMKKNFTEGINIMMGISRKQEYLSRVIQNARALIYKNVCAPSDITKLPWIYKDAESDLESSLQR